MPSWAASKTIKIAVKILTSVPYASNIWISYYTVTSSFSQLFLTLVNKLIMLQRKVVKKPQYTCTF